MTNYYSSGGVTFPVNNDKDKQLVITTLEAMDWIYDQWFPWTGEGDRQALPQLKKLLILVKGNKDIARLVRKIALQEYYYGGLDYYESDKDLFIYNDENIEVGFLDPITGQKGSLTVNAFSSVPIFVNDYIDTETTGGLSGVTRITAGCLDEGVGLTGFIPARTGKLLEISPVVQHQDRDSVYRRLRLIAGLALYSTKALAQWIKIASS